MSVFNGVEHLALAVAALGGVLAARDKQIDLFGVVTLALVTALGGGTLRDMALGALPVVWVRDASFLLTASAVALVAFVALRHVQVPQRVFLVADAFALALFTIGGVTKGLAFGVQPAVAITLGVITGVVGGVIRDTLLGEIPLVFRRETNFYATAAFCGAVTYLLLHRFSSHETLNTLLAITITLALRLASIRWDLALPHFSPARPARAKEPDK